MTLLDDVLDDLAAEGEALEAMVVALDDAGWRTPTPATGWDVATQVVHLAWTDEVAVAAATDKAAWDALVLQASRTRRATSTPRRWPAPRPHRSRSLPGGERPGPRCNRPCATTPRARRCRGSAPR